MAEAIIEFVESLVSFVVENPITTIVVLLGCLAVIYIVMKLYQRLVYG